ncbi:hypothetical protein P856_562 [Candidatus Endolissoclinum faulkneri L5]|uniref:DUF4167 domain-containing protein n=1 Tax=Candidatus Endolissoclinum faulkneri L5 TaxID=1401328 RepID=V9TT72_9PROT|nr:hypothetical protein P856_562 [Candidatus Endolissoclinum faulkneri L5]
MFKKRSLRTRQWFDFETTGNVVGMRQGPHQKRNRGRSNCRTNTPNRNQTFDSNGPDVRIRGNANQVYEKYLALGRDAAASGDRVLAESYFQHADHYYRIVSAFAEDEADRHDRNNFQVQQHNGAPRDSNEEEVEDSRLASCNKTGNNRINNSDDNYRSERRSYDGQSSSFERGEKRNVKAVPLEQSKKKDTKTAASIHQLSSKTSTKSNEVVESVNDNAAQQILRVSNNKEDDLLAIKGRGEDDEPRPRRKRRRRGSNMEQSVNKDIIDTNS